MSNNRVTKMIIEYCYECPHNGTIEFTPEQYKRLPEDAELLCNECLKGEYHE